MRSDVLYMLTALAGLDAQTSAAEAAHDTGLLQAMRELSPLALVLLFVLLLVDRLPNVLAKWKAIRAGESAQHVRQLDEDLMDALKSQAEWWKRTGRQRLNELHAWHSPDLPGSRYPGEKTWHNLTVLEALHKQASHLADVAQTLTKVVDHLDRDKPGC